MINIARPSINLIVLICLFPGIYSDGPNIEHLQKIYETSRPGQLPCYYDGTLCNRSEEYCSTRSKTCEPVFKLNSTEAVKRAKCKDILSKTEEERGIKDVCIYFFGLMESLKNDIESVKPEDKKSFQGSHPLKGAGKEYCPYAGKDCQLGMEICNSTSKKCELLFPPGATDEDKRHMCQEVTKRNDTLLRDGCIYALGMLGCPKLDATATKESPPIALCVSMTVFFFMVALAVVLAVMFCWHKKKCCFKKSALPQSAPAGRTAKFDANKEPEATVNLLPDNGDSGHVDENIINMRTEGAREMENRKDNLE